MYVTHRKIKGRTYRYLESSRSEQFRKSKCLGQVPTLPDEAPFAVVLFAGGGGVECGMIQAGIRPVLSVEFDPTKPKLSRALAAANHLNFKPYGGRVIKRTVQALARAGFPDFPRQPDYLHASPVCANFSRAKNHRGETQLDKEMALAIALAILVLQPKCFTLENVCQYQHSESWSLIESVLKDEGYHVLTANINAADYGVPQSRERFIVKALKGEVPNFPPAGLPQCGWYEALVDLIPALPDSDLLPDQLRVVREKINSATYPIRALLVERTGYRDGTPQLKEPLEPCWTIKRSIFTDQRENNRSKFIDIWLADGTVKAVTVEAIARLQGFPRWYCLPQQVSVAGSLLGYSVPPPLMRALVGSD